MIYPEPEDAAERGAKGGRGKKEVRRIKDKLARLPMKPGGFD
jgi:hypothetical protein